MEILHFALASHNASNHDLNLLFSSTAAVDLGDVPKIRIGHDNSGAGPGWFLESVVIEEGTLKQPVTFTCKRWLDTREVGFVSMMSLVICWRWTSSAESTAPILICLS
jgi:hypothetical protein